MSEIRHLSRLIAIVAVIGLTACSDDGDERLRISFEAQPCTAEFTETEAGARSMGFPSFITRSDPEDPAPWTPPASYITYESIYGTDGMFKDQKNLVNKSVDAFFTKDVAFTTDSKNYQEGVFFYRKSDKKWHLNMEIASTGDYYLYGYIPKEDVGSATIAANPTFSEGAVLTLHDLNTVTPSDVCVIVGAKEGEANTSLVKTGDFKVYANAAVKDPSSATSPETNYIFLLFDHLYSALRFNFTVDAAYDALRTIKLRQLELRACNASYTSYVTEHCDATVTLTANETGASPVVSVNFGTLSTVPITDTNPDAGYMTLYTWDNIENTPADATHEVILQNGQYSRFLGCFTPGSGYYFQLRSTYDVYDKKGNLIRKGCRAVNKLNLLTIFGEYTQLQRGQCYSLSIKVQPTYLYMLSEPDLDNPTLKIEH